MSIPVITIKDLTKIFPKKEGRRRVEALKNVNLTVHEGEFLILLGPSGCGKSTLLRIMAGLDTHTGGHLTFDTSYNPRKSSFVFQNFAILPWLTVAQNISLNLIGNKVPQKEKDERVKHILDVFELTRFKDRFPHELSGGMKQRVGLARAFVINPQTIFLDEPFSELDFFTAQNLRQILLTLWETQKTTVVMVSHYIEEAVLLADRIAVFSSRPGTIKTIITNELPRPRKARSAPFFAVEDTLLKYLGDEKHTI